MFYSPIDYETPVFRPPSEAKSHLIQVTIGCSNNKCTYCDMYRSKTYRVRSMEDITRDLEKSKVFFNQMGMDGPRRIFLCDGDALGAPMEVLIPTLEKIEELFPKLDRVGIYATAENMLEKSLDELKELGKLKLNMAYLGMESGSDSVLHRIVKGNNSQDMIDGPLRLREAGFKVSTIAMLGIGGQKFTQEHVRETARVISQTKPEYFSFLTTMTVPGTPLGRMVERGSFKELTAREMLQEMHDILKGLTLSKEDRIIFRANHVSNQYPLGGTLPRDLNKILGQLKEWIASTPEGVFPPRPSTM